jgi:hypothetical protein
MVSAIRESRENKKREPGGGSPGSPLSGTIFVLLDFRLAVLAVVRCLRMILPAAGTGPII